VGGEGRNCAAGQMALFLRACLKEKEYVETVQKVMETKKKRKRERVI